MERGHPARNERTAFEGRLKAELKTAGILPALHIAK